MSGLQLEESAGFDRQTLDYIRRAAASGLYEIRGLGAKRRVPNFDDLLFLAASLSRYPVGGLPRALRDQNPARHALRVASPIELAIPITVAGMSFGAHCRHGSKRRNRPCGHGGRHLDHHRRRRHDRGGA